MGGERPRLRGLMRRIEQAARQGKPHDRNLTRLEQELEESIERRQRRRANVPRVTYPSDLPISERREEIATAIQDHQVVVVCGETGSGKSTQLPKICLELGRGIDGLIGHTQPRRIAARTLARRVAEELNTTPGREVGFKIRFTDATQPETYIKLMTDGILLAETQRDRMLTAYDTLIIDEAHERSLNIDFLLGYLKQLLPKRPDLKVIITSATIDPQKFAAHFANSRGEPVPIIEVSGRTYPVEVRYRPIEADDSDRQTGSDAVKRGIMGALDELAGAGDTLVFLPTERDIRDMGKALRGADVKGEVLPLYSRLSTAEQDRVFRPTSRRSGGRRIVLATNVAETSLTVPGIRCVIDTGTARISRYSARSGVQRLPIEPIAQSSADQRKGRCGRIAEGICIRLYSEEDYLGRETFTPPEILRTNLASVILQMKALGLGEVRDFPFVDPPRPGAIRDGYETLFELGAIEDTGELTDIGRKLSSLPVDPRIGRMILAADTENCVSDILIIAAALESQDPRLRPAEQQQAADASHAQFADNTSDFLSYLKLWDFYHGLKEKLSRSQLDRACRQNFLSPARLREWTDIHRQLRDMTQSLGIRVRARRGEADPIHRALLTGLLSNIAMRGDGFEYIGGGGKKLFLWPGSALFEAKPRWIMAAELVETSRLYARTVARIQPTWIEPIARHLVKRSYSQPHWQPESGHVAAFERVSLHGLTIVPRRQVHYGPIDPSAARQLFIHHALVSGESNLRAPFLENNRKLIEQVEKVEAKARRRDLLADEQARYAYYDQRVPPGIYDLPTFNKWRKQAERSNARLLFMTEADLLRESSVEVTRQAFPDSIRMGSVTLPLTYHLEPGAAEDGVTVTCPLAAVGQLERTRLDWLVPGLIREKVMQMIRSLPRAIRKHFVPAPEFADQVVDRIEYGVGSLREAVAAALSNLSGQPIEPAAFNDESLPSHLRMNIHVIDEVGKITARSRDLDDLRQQLGPQSVDEPVTSGDDRWHRDGITLWDFGELPEQVTVRQGGHRLPRYPAIVDRGESVSLRLVDSVARAQRETRAGVRRLLAMQVGREVRHHVEQTSGMQTAAMNLASKLDGTALKRQVVDLVVDRAFLADQPAVTDAAEFEHRLNAGWNRIAQAADEVGRQIVAIAQAYQQASLAMADLPQKQTWQYARVDVTQQIALLMAGDFLSATPWNWLVQYPRYLVAVDRRLRKLRNGGMARDAKQYAALLPHWRRCLEQYERHQKQRINVGPELERYRWMVEEFRVSLFAQDLGTSVPVSVKRLENQWRQTGES